MAEVVEPLDLSGIYALYDEREGRGLATCDPRVLLTESITKEGVPPGQCH